MTATAATATPRPFCVVQPIRIPTGNSWGGHRYMERCKTVLATSEGEALAIYAAAPVTLYGEEEAWAPPEAIAVQSYESVRAEVSKLRPRDTHGLVDHDTWAETRGYAEILLDVLFEVEAGGGDGWNEPRYGASAIPHYACKPHSHEPCPRRTYWIRHPANRRAMDRIVDSFLTNYDG